MKSKAQMSKMFWILDFELDLKFGFCHLDFYQGKSTPPRCQGWHFNILFIPDHNPFLMPYFSIDW